MKARKASRPSRALSPASWPIRIGPPTSRFEIRPLNKPRTVRTICVEASTVDFRPPPIASRHGQRLDWKSVPTATPIRATGATSRRGRRWCHRRGERDRESSGPAGHLERERRPGAAAGAPRADRTTVRPGAIHRQDGVALLEAGVRRRPARTTCPITAARNGWRAWEALSRPSSASGWIGTVDVPAVIQLDPNRCGALTMPADLVPGGDRPPVDGHDARPRPQIRAAPRPPAGTSSGTTRPTVVTGSICRPFFAARN